MIMNPSSIGDALFTKTQQRVLGLLFGKPDARFYTNEILRRIDMGRGTVRRELERLTAAGILRTSREGNQLYYQANHNSPVYPELLGLVRKTFGIAEVIRAALQPLNAQITLAFVYGSLAKATDRKTSDLDLMIVSDSLAYSDVMDVLLPLEKTLMRHVNPTLYSAAEFHSKLAQGSSFLSRVLEQPKLWVKRSDDDIGGAG
jgi:predicted nucleotidyltransferase